MKILWARHINVRWHTIYVVIYPRPNAFKWQSIYRLGGVPYEAKGFVVNSCPLGRTKTLKLHEPIDIKHWSLKIVCPHVAGSSCHSAKNKQIDIKCWSLAVHRGLKTACPLCPHVSRSFSVILLHRKYGDEVMRARYSP